MSMFWHFSECLSCVVKAESAPMAFAIQGKNSANWSVTPVYVGIESPECPYEELRLLIYSSGFYRKHPLNLE